MKNSLSDLPTSISSFFRFQYSLGNAGGFPDKEHNINTSDLLNKIIDVLIVVTTDLEVGLQCYSMAFERYL